MSQISRRRFLHQTLTASAGLSLTGRVAFGQAPVIIASDRSRPQMPSGIQFGDPLSDRVMVWSRADRAARLIVERAFREDFRDAIRVEGPLTGESSGFTARLDLTGLPPDREVFTRVWFEDPANQRVASAPLTGRFRTAPASRRSVRFIWSADTAGQGYGINPAWGGMRTYESIRLARPDFFIHSGDTIYADNPIPSSITLDDGATWQNVVTEETSKVAETLREFRGRFAYNLTDECVRRFSAEVPQIWQWDDHEVMNNWSDSKDLTADNRYTEKSVRVLAARAKQAFLEFAPMRPQRADATGRVYRKLSYGPLIDVFVLDQRSYRAPNSDNRQEAPDPETSFMGAEQIAWLKGELERSRATWKIIASDMPIGLLVPDDKDKDGRQTFDAVANGDGPVLGREHELADLFRFVKNRRIRNLVWITGDVHYAAAHYYDPAKAVFSEFDGFWEFVAGPLNAGSFGPNVLDPTFGPQVMFQKFPSKPNAPPSAGYQFFGQVDVDGKSGELTVTLKDVSGAAVYAKLLVPAS